MLRSTFTKLLKPLEYAVQVRRTGGGGGEWWETIAAFDVDIVAQDYMERCAKGSCAALEYRLVSLNGERSDDVAR